MGKKTPKGGEQMNGEERRRGRVTIPTDLDVVPQTL